MVSTWFNTVLRGSTRLYVPAVKRGSASCTPHAASPPDCGPCLAGRAAGRPTSHTLSPCSTQAGTVGVEVLCSCPAAGP